jgi:hypothetical protein
MNKSIEETRPPKFLENLLLLLAGLLAHLPLYYQLPRWGYGLDPTFVHPKWVGHSISPWAAHMVAVHPFVWICLTVLALVRLCHNYGWKLERSLRGSKPINFAR